MCLSQPRLDARLSQQSRWRWWSSFTRSHEHLHVPEPPVSSAPLNRALAQRQHGQQRASVSGARLDNVKLSRVKTVTSGCDFQSEIAKEEARHGAPQRLLNYWKSPLKYNELLITIEMYHSTSHVSFTTYHRDGQTKTTAHMGTYGSDEGHWFNIWLNSG